MSLNRISFLEGWERSPAAFLRGREEPSDSESESYQDLPEPSLSSSFPSTYSRLNFNPYAGPAWNESADDREDRPSLLGSLGLGLSPTTTRDSRVDAEQGATGPGSVHGPSSPAAAEPGPVKVPMWLSETKGAFEVRPAKRIAQVCLAVVYCFLAAGVVFGFAALKPVLIRENVYRDLCSSEELEEGVLVCDGQEIRLNLMFTIAAVATNVSALPVGAILDAYGPRVSGLIGSLFLALGSTLFAWAGRLPCDGYIIGYLLLSLGGPFIFISSFHLSNTFPTRSGLILSTLTGAFDASSALFLVFRLLSEYTQGYVSIRKFFLIYLAVPMFITVVQLTIMPVTSYKTTGELFQQAEAQFVDESNDQVDDTFPDQHEGERQRNARRVYRRNIVHQIQDLLDDGATPCPGNHTPPPNAPNTQTSGVWGVLHGHSALHQLSTPWFGLITAFTVLMMLRINYFVATLRSQYSYLLASETSAAQINTVFDILLPVGGLVSIPFIGTFLDTLKTRTVLAILVTAATVIGTVGCIPHSLTAAYINITLFVLYRPFYYTAVSDYAAKIFGFLTFGKVYGLIICLAGVGNFAQAGLDAVTLKVFDGNPIPVNIALTTFVFVIGSALIGFVSWQTSLLCARERLDRGGTQMHRNENESPTIQDVRARDWEEEPLLQSGEHEAEHRAYGT
ncbi:Major facilitator superfamily domain general substrate transporter [Penicillium capsulatum]|nr:Major facilitator superfamily domain general substrate transporter [Penicillium capsulatum]